MYETINLRRRDAHGAYTRQSNPAQVSARQHAPNRVTRHAEHASHLRNAVRQPRHGRAANHASTAGRWYRYVRQPSRLQGSPSARQRLIVWLVTRSWRANSVVVSIFSVVDSVIM